MTTSDTRAVDARARVRARARRGAARRGAAHLAVADNDRRNRHLEMDEAQHVCRHLAQREALAQRGVARDAAELATHDGQRAQILAVVEQLEHVQPHVVAHLVDAGERPLARPRPLVDVAQPPREPPRDAERRVDDDARL